MIRTLQRKFIVTAMIAVSGYFKYLKGEFVNVDVVPYSSEKNRVQ